MVKSEAETVEGYLAALPEDKRDVVEKVRAVILKHLPEGYVETINWGMISYEIPLETYPDTYNGKPLSYAALAVQKRHFSLYLNGVYQNPDLEAELRQGFEEAGKKLDMGKSCVRFKGLDAVPLEVIGDVIASTPPHAYIAQYEASRK
jgi:uncharacterized protein YdhG (YjbR/CyaY superfamily)